MSGKLVGEVFDAREAGLLEELPAVELLALVAIAEKAYEATRLGQVRMSRIQAATGKSRRTAERAVSRLKKRGLIRVVKRGSNSQGNNPQAPVYELVLPPPKTAEVVEGTSANMDGGSSEEVLPPFPEVLPPKSQSTSAILGSTSAIQGGDHDGSYDGSYDGKDDVGRTSGASATTRARAFDELFRQAPSEPVAPPPPEPPPLDVEEVSPYGRCDVCNTGLDENGGCSRCFLRQGRWKEQRREGA